MELEYDWSDDFTDVPYIKRLEDSIIWTPIRDADNTWIYTNKELVDDLPAE